MAPLACHIFHDQVIAVLCVGAVQMAAWGSSRVWLFGGCGRKRRVVVFTHPTMWHAGVPKQNFGLAADPADASRYPSPMDLPLAPAITAAQPPQPPQTYGAPPQPAVPPPQAPAPAPAQPPQPTAPPATYPTPAAPPAPPVAAPQPVAPSAPSAYSHQPPPQMHAAAVPAAAAPAVASTAQKEEAKKQARTAISALNFDDVPSAANSLRAALRALGVSLVQCAFAV